MSAKRFRIAFSFAGEKRDFVAKVAALLARRFTEADVLYDKFHEAEFARRDLGIYLPELYHDHSELLVVVVCPDYDVKQWTGLEWTAIHDLLSKGKDADVMLCRFDQATVHGLFSTAGFVELVLAGDLQHAIGIEAPDVLPVRDFVEVDEANAYFASALRTDHPTSYEIGTAPAKTAPGPPRPRTTTACACPLA